MRLRRRRFFPFVVAGLLSVAAYAQEKPDLPTGCPVEISSVKAWPVVTEGVITPTFSPWRHAKLHFKYTNISGRDIQSVSLRVRGRVQVSGPKGMSFLDSSQEVVADGRLGLGKSKKTSVKLSPGALTGLQVELTHVNFADGKQWANDAALQCVH